MKKMRKIIVGLASIILLCLSLSVSAISLAEAKASGFVGEQANGYLGLTGKNNSSEVQQLVANINQQRREYYQQIAQKTGGDVNSVAALAGQRAVNGAAPGHYVQMGGNWVKK